MTILIYLLSFFCAYAEAAEIPLSLLTKHGLHSYLEPQRSRLLVEGANPDAQSLFLLDVPYALVQGQFVGLPEPLLVKGSEILFPMQTAELYLFPLLSETERKSLAAEVQSPKVDVNKGDPRCNSVRAVKKVFIDPGHGGNDLGTKFGSLFEKDITLKFGILVAEELRRRGFTVSFSRTKDVYLPLDIRSTLAKKWDADLFVSIHMNSAPSKDAHGTETYILSADGTDAEARKLALIENSIVQKASSKQSAVQDILWDMEQTTYLQDSAFLASYIQKQVVQTAHEFLHAKKIEWKNRGVRQAPFFVLSRAAMPAVLVELGYLSNAQDRKLLTDKNFQESLAKAVANGVKQYEEACKAH